MHAFARFLAIGLCAAATASAVHAQLRSAPASSQQAVPSAAARAATALPNPGGLRPPFPAGLTSGSGARVSTDPIAANSAPPVDSSVVPGNGFGNVGNGFGNGFGPAFPGGVIVNPDGFAGVPVAPATNVLGAGATVPGPSQYLAGAGGVSAVDQARAFHFADANGDGELTRAEAARLAIRTMGFEQMDRNFDQVITRFEYQDAFR